MPPAPSSLLLTDRYELTMLDAALASGIGARRAVFETFCRRLPPGRPYGVVCGIERLLDLVDRFRAGPDELAFVSGLGLGPATLDLLGRFAFSGDVWGFTEGEVFLPDDPLLTVEATFAEAVVLETLVLSVLNHDCAIAAAASCIRAAAGEGATLIDMGTRRADPYAAVAAARAAYLAGFDATSNLEAGRTYGVPTAGTVAHAFILAHAAEADAFRAQMLAQGTGTTVLVDTYDTVEGIRAAVAVANGLGAPGPGAVRIDSGDLAEEARRARRLLDELGATGTRVVLSGDLDAARIAELVAAGVPVDVFGVGTSVATGDGHPTAGLVYKLVAIEDEGGAMRPVAKRSAAKATMGGRKAAWRHPGGRTERSIEHPPGWAPVGATPLQVPYVRAGRRFPRPTLPEARAHHARARQAPTPLA